MMIGPGGAGKSDVYKNVYLKTNDYYGDYKQLKSNSEYLFRNPV